MAGHTKTKKANGRGTALSLEKRSKMIDKLVEQVKDWDLETLILYSEEAYRRDLAFMNDKNLKAEYKWSGIDE